MNRKQLLASAPVFPSSLCPLALRSALGDLNRRRMSSRVRARAAKKSASGFFGSAERLRNMPLSSLLLPPHVPSPVNPPSVFI